MNDFSHPTRPILSLSWQPRYTLTPAMARGLMEIEAARAVVEHTPLPVEVEAELRRLARIRATHYSTRIEGNRLTLAEAQEVIEGRVSAIHGRERDVREIQNYWNALLRVEEWAAQYLPFSEDLIQRLHALVEKGIRPAPRGRSAYRNGQNAIRDSLSGALVYLPPSAEDVPGMMAGLVQWTQQAERDQLPVPLLAGLVHYQFVTIHPYFDGNGRTARLLATFVLHKGGYGLNGYFSLEEHHARDLAAYYRSLAVHPHHNYYEGRADADLTTWLEYFMGVVASVFTAAKTEALRLGTTGAPVEPAELRSLDHRARTVLALFAKHNTITASLVAAALGVSQRTARYLLQGWTADGWLVVADPARRSRSYQLSTVYRQFIGNLSTMP